MTDETKNIFQSKTIIGSIVALTAVIVSSFFGYNISIDDKTELTDIIVGTAGSFGALIAIYGRIKASKKIALTK